MIEDIAEFSKRKIKSIVHDAVKTAKAINLVYVSDQGPGIRRVRSGKTFKYLSGKSVLSDKVDLLRIKSLVIPPAWENVWICPLANGHLQATGTDVKKRKQYRYHPNWNLLRNQTKFYHTYEFGKVLPAMRSQIQKDLSLPGLPAQKVLATVVSLMERTNIRVGNITYERLYGSYGLTTLKDKHVTLEGNTIGFTFKGKKGVEHIINLKSKKLAEIVKRCRDIPGKELFQYYNEKGERKSIDSGMVNDYIKNISGSNFTAKDFRTWSGTVQSLIAFKELGFFESQTEARKKITEAFKIVSRQLGNSPNVCKKYYVHPVIINLYETKGLERYIAQLDQDGVNDVKADLSREEIIVMKILESN